VSLLVAGAALVVASSSAGANILIRIDKAAQRMTVTVDGVKKYTWPVSTGKPGYATPSGSFYVFRMEKKYASKEWDNAPMPNTMFFTPQGNAIHGSYQTGYLGTPVSHGCVRLAPANAAKLFSLVQGDGLWTTQVIITGPSPGLPPGETKPIPPGLLKKKPQLQAFSMDQFGNWLKH
jgi:lipoprotein-anchoring transpeptidase ErfK/SrfK